MGFSEAVAMVAEELISIWNQLKVVIIEKRSIVARIKTLVKKFQSKKKSKNRKTAKEIYNRSKFVNKIYNLFDISAKTKPRSCAAIKFLDQQRNRQKYRT